MSDSTLPLSPSAFVQHSKAVLACIVVIQRIYRFGLWESMGVGGSMVGRCKAVSGQTGVGSAGVCFRLISGDRDKFEVLSKWSGFWDTT
jgi:hypothetical protein